MIVEFEATADDFVDVTRRSQARMKSTRYWAGGRGCLQPLCSRPS